MIDHATLSLVSKFTHRTHLTADLSHANHAEEGRDRAVAVGNYDYDDGSQASILESDNNQILENNGRGLPNPIPMAGANTNSRSLSNRINQDNSAINQLRKVFQSVHMNQRVVTTTISFDPNPTS